MFTRDQIEEIKKKLIMLGTKDTQFPDAHKLNGEEIIAIVQDGENKKIPLSSIINDDFINVSKDTTEILTLSTAVSKIDINNRKLGQVITFKDSANSWAIRQFTGSSLDNWNDISLWKSISGIDELKSQVETNAENISVLSDEIERHNASILNLNTDVSKLKDKDIETSSSLSELTTRVDTLKSQADTNTSNISSINTEVSTLQSKVDENTTSISQINTTLEEHTESIKANITTDRISDGAVTSEKIATDAFDSTLSVSGKIAPADVVGGKLTDLDSEIVELAKIATEEITPDRIYKEKYRYKYEAIEPDEIKENYRIKGYTTTAPVGKIITGTSEINGVYLHIYTIGDKKKVQMTIPDYSVIGFNKSIFAFVGRRNDEDGYCMRYFTLAQIQENTYGCFEIKDGILTVDVDAWRQNGVGIISYFDVSATNQIYFVSTNDTDRLVVLEAKEFSYKLSDFKWLEQDGNIEEVVLPRKIIGATGIEMNLYKDNALLYTNIDSVCAVKFMDFPAGAFECKTRFRCKPTTTRDSNPQFSVFLNQFKNADIVKNVNLRIVDSSIVSGKSPNVLVIGDSKVNGGRLSSELRKDLTANGATPNFIGTIKADAFNIYHEGRSGWKSADYTKPTTKTNYPNAFWDGSKFNFTYYMTQNGFSGVDYVFINLGTNDYASSANLGKLDYINDFISNINTMISSIRQYDSNVPIVVGLAEGVCTYQWSSSVDNYLNNLNTRARLLNKAAIAEWDNRESEKLFVCPLYLSMDMENDYVMTDVPLSDRDETHTTGKTRQSVTDTMHQSAVGYGKNADYMFAMIAYIESGM